MSKQVRTLILAGVAVVALVALLLVLVFLLPGSGGEDASSTAVSDTSVTVLDKSTDADGKTVDNPIKSIQITLRDETFTFSQNEDGDLVADPYKDLPINTSEISYLVSTLKTVTATKEISSNPESPSDYGFTGEFAAPDSSDASAVSSSVSSAAKAEKAVGLTAQISVTYHDDSIHSFEVGRESPTTERYYLREVGTNPVYLVDSTFASTISQPSTAYIGRNVVTAPTVKTDDDNGQAILREIELTGRVRTSPLILRRSTADDNLNNSSNYVITKPYFRAANSSSAVVTALGTYTSVTASGVEKPYPTAEDLKRYGLDDPYSTAVFTLAVETTETSETSGESAKTSYYNIQKHTIQLGNKNDNGEYYALVYNEDQRIPVVYLFSASSVAWAEAQYDDVAETLLFLRNIDSLSNVILTAGGRETDFALEHFPDASEKDDQMKVTADGQQYDTDNFRNLYQVLMSIYRKGAAPAEPAGDPVLSIKLVPTTASDGVVELSIYKHDPNVFIVRFTTGETYAVNASEVNEAVKQLGNYLEGKDVKVN